MKRLPAALAAILIFVVLILNWIQPASWHVESLLDGSWQYSLERFRHAGIFLGRDVFYTYGVLSQWVGFPIHEGPISSVSLSVGIVCCLGIAISVFYSFSSLSLGFSFLFLPLYLAVFPMALHMDRANNDVVYNLLLIQSFVLFYFLNSKEKSFLRLNSFFIFVGLLSLIKFSFGIHGLVLGVALLYLQRRFLKPLELLASLAILALFPVILFKLLTGSFGFYTALWRAYLTTSAYSELMIGHYSGDDSKYLVGILMMSLYIACVAALIQPWSKSETKGIYSARERWVFLGCACFSSFALFKHGFVRADGHEFLSYYTWAPLLILTAAQLTRACDARLRVLALMFVAAGFFPLRAHLRHFGRSTTNEFRTSLMAYGEAAHRMSSLINSGLPLYTGEQAKREQLIKRFPNLAARIALLCSSGASSISYLPWETSFYELSIGCALKPFIGLQIYQHGPGSWEHMQEKLRILRGEGPDYYVIGDGALSENSGLSDYSTFLEELLRFYSVEGAYDGYVILKKNLSGQNKTLAVVKCMAFGPGQFLKLRVDSTWLERLCFKIVKFLFKTPQLFAVINHDGMQTRAQVHFSQMINDGVFFSGQSITELLLNPTMAFKNIESAKLVKAPTWHDIPVFRGEKSIEVQFCKIQPSPSE